MDMIRWLATNKVVLAVWGLGILAILLSAIFGGSKETEHAVVATETKVVEAAVEETKSVASTVAATAAATTAAAASTVQAAVDTTVDAASETTDKVVEKAEAVMADTTETTSESENTAAEEGAAQVASTEAASVQAVEEINLSDKSSDDLLMMAREAYWNNGLDEAAGLYGELISREPSVIEHKGELGNVFWRQGYPKKAAELYADIAEPMIANGNGERVSNMVGFISLFFPERAANIRKQLDAQ